MSEALRPAAATDRWQRLGGSDFPACVDAAFTTLSVVEAANAEEEALTIAVALREAIETAGETAALITPDRELARRVLAALERWHIPVDDSGGDALPDTSAGRFARLAAEAALGGLAPVTLLALLKHPLTRLGAPEGANTRAVAALERSVLRGPRPKPKSRGLARALATFREERGKFRRREESDLHPSDPRLYLSDGELVDAAALLEQFTAAIASLEILSSAPRSFVELAARHCDVVTALSRDERGQPAAFAGHDGVKLYEAFDDIASANADAGLVVAQADYAELFKIAIADRVVRRPEFPNVRVRIYGPLEARLQTVDRVVLGGLVEGVWPPETRPDPWLSRPMRHALGLDLPERRISLSAHDFAQALGADEVMLAYPAKLAGTPTVVSRFVQRLAAVAGEHRWSRHARGAGPILPGLGRSIIPPRSSAWTSPRPGRRAPHGR